MSIDVAKPLPASGTRTASPPSQFETFVDGQLETTRQQVKLSELFAAGIGLTAWFIGFLLLAVIVDSWIYPFGSAARMTSFSILISGCLFIILRYVAPLFFRRISRLYAAKMIEDASPKFHNSLVNYLQLKSDRDHLKQGIVQAVSQRAARDLSSISPSEKVDRSRPIQFGFVLASLVLILVGYAIFSPKSPWPSISRVLNPISRVAPPSVVQVWKVTPGDAEVFFGQKLLVTAEIRGRHDAESVQLIYSTDDGQHSLVPVTMRPTGTANSYQLELATTPAGIDGPLRYSIEAHDGRSSEFQVSVRANPAIAVQKIDIIPPKYTKLPERTLEGKNEIEALEGSSIKIHAIANMPIQVAYVELLNQRTNKDKNVDYDLIKTVEMQLDQETNAIGSFVLLLDPSRSKPQFTHYQLRFLSTDGNRNQLVNVHPVRILPDLAPEVKIVRPVDRHPRVPLNRALDIEIQAADLDFEIGNIQLILDHQGSQLLDEDIELPNSSNRQRVTSSFRLEPRKFQLKPGDQVIFHARANDNRVSAYSNLPEPNVSRSDNYTLTIDPPSADDVAENAIQQDEPATDSSAQSADQNNAESTNTGSSDSDSAKDADNKESKAGETKSGDSAEKGLESSSSAPGQNSEPEKMTETPPIQSGDLKNSENQLDPAANQQRDSTELKSDNAEQDGSKDPSDKNRADDPPKQPEKSDLAENSSDKSDTNQKSDGNQEPRNKQKPDKDQESGKKDPSGSSNSENKQSTRNDKGDANQPDKNSGSENKSPNAKSSDQAGGKSGKSDSDKSEQSKSQPGESSALSDSKSTDTKAANDPDNQGPASKKPNSGDKTANSEKQNGEPDDVDPGDPQKEMDKNATDGERMERLLKMAEQKERDQQAAKPDNKNQDTNQPGETSKQPEDKSANNNSSNQDKSKPDDQTGKKGGNQPSSNDPNKQSDNQGKSESKNPPSKSEENAKNSDNQKKQSDQTSQQSSQSPQKGDAPQGKQPGDNDATKAAQPNSPGDGSNNPKGQKSEEKGSKQGTGQSGQPSDKSSDPKSGSGDSGQPGGQGGSEAGKKEDGKQPSGNSQGGESKTGGQPGQQEGSQGSKSDSGQGSGGDSKHGGDISNRGGPGKSPSGTTPTQKSEGHAEGPAEPNPTDEAKEAQKATDLVLDYLKDQANKPDPDLLSQMNWTEQDLRDFLARWEEMKARSGTGDPTQKKRYEDALRSLDLRTEATRKNTLKSQRDKLNNLSEDGTVNRPPAELAEQFNTFMKNRNRETKDK